MKIFVKNAYGGSICTIKFENESKDIFGYGFKISGFIETNKIKVQHITSKESYILDEVSFKVPKNIIPSFSSKHYKVYYTCECTMIFKEMKNPFSFQIEIRNNNFADFLYPSPIELSFNLVDKTEYLEAKKTACEMLLKKLNDKPGKRKMKKNSKINILADEKEETPFIKSSQNIISQSSSNIDLSGEESPYSSPKQGNHTHLNQEIENLLEEELESESTSKSNTLQTQEIILKTPELNKSSDEKPENAEQSSKEDQIIDKMMLFTLNNKEDVSTPQISEIANSESAILAGLLKEEESVDSKLFQEFQPLQDRLKCPDFPHPNILQISAPETQITITNESEKIATSIYPSFMSQNGSLHLKYLKNIKNTKIIISKNFLEDDVLMDMESVYYVFFDSDNCIEKLFEFTASDFSLKTFVFEVSYTLTVILDGKEFSVPILITNPHLKSHFAVNGQFSSYE